MVFPCKVCNKTFLSRNALAEHNYVHTGETIICPVCDQRLSSYRNLRRHDQTFHEPERQANARREQRKREKADREEYICKLERRIIKLNKENDQLKLKLMNLMSQKP